MLSGISVSLAISIGRIFGFLREVLQASSFGQSYQADTLSLSLMLPDTLVNIVLGGAFTAAFMPVFAKSSLADSYNFMKLLHKSLGLFFLLLAFIMYAIANKISFIFAPDLDFENQMLLSNLLKITCWSLPFIVFSGIVTVELNARGVFFLPALGTAFINFIICLALLLTLYLPTFGVYIVATSLVFGAALRWAFQIYPYRTIRQSVGKKNYISINKTEIFARYSHSILSISVLILMPLITRYYMLQTGQGQLANYSYTQKLMDLLITLIVGSIITVILPKLALKNEDAIEKIWKLAAFLFPFFIITSLLYYFLVPFLVKLLFYHGAFDLDAVSNLSQHMQQSAYIIPFYAIMYYLSGSLSVTSLAFRNALSCLLSISVFVLLLRSQISDLNYVMIYKNMLISYALCVFLQFLFIFTHVNRLPC